MNILKLYLLLDIYYDNEAGWGALTDYQSVSVKACGDRLVVHKVINNSKQK